MLDYRKAASFRSTFHNTLLSGHKIFQTELERLAEKENVPPSSCQPPPGNQINRRRNPERQRIDGIIPERIIFAPVLPMQTPKKMKSLLHKGIAPIEVEKMVEGCTGMPTKSYPYKQMRCSLCDVKTSWYCIGCKRWFCMDRRNTEKNKKEAQLYSHDVRGKQLTFQKICFHQAHQNAWEAATMITP